jgi:lambda family phage portal protein
MLPQIQIIDGRHIKTPYNVNTKNKTIKNGIEFDSQNRVVAYWVKNKRIPAFGEKSKRRLAWMVYGTQKLIDHTRGIPLLGCALQALREIDRYTDSELRASFLNSILTAWIKKTDSPGAMPQFGRAAITNQDVEATQVDGSTKTSTFSQFLPGIMLDKLAPGEEPVSFNTSRPNLNFGDFVKVILSGVAWGNGLPPEIYFLNFQNNFSASRQASNEFKTFLHSDRAYFSKQFCKPYYDEWLTDYALLGKTIMPGYLEALRDPMQWEIRNAWQKAKWIGVSRPSVDPMKEINAMVTAIDNNLMSVSDGVMELRGDDFDKVIRRKKSEQEKIDEMLGSDPEVEIEDPEDPENVLDIGA